MMIFPGTHEAVKIAGQEYDLTSQEYINEWKEGFRYLNRFELDVLPTYTYQIGDLLIKKTVSLEYGKNTSVVCYELMNGMEEVTFAVTPMFTYRGFGQTKERAELKFGKKLCKLDSSEQCVGSTQYLRLVPQEEPSVSIKFYASEGKYYDRALKPVSMATPNYLIEENQVYPIDNRTGFLGVDNHITPYDVLVTVKPYETKKFYVKCTIEDLDEKDGFTIADDYRRRIESLMNQIPYDDRLARRLDRKSVV